MLLTVSLVVQKENIHSQVVQNGDAGAILGRHVEFETLCGTQCNWRKFEFQKMNIQSFLIPLGKEGATVLKAIKMSVQYKVRNREA